MKTATITRMGLTLAAICLVAAAALAVTYRMTRPTIEARTRADRVEALKVVLPDAVEFSQRISGEKIDYYRGFDRDGELAGYAFIGEARGYSSDISVMVGIDPSGEIAGIEILSQQETPGLGTRAVEVPATRTFWEALLGREAEEPPGRPLFQEQFSGKTVDRLEVVTGETETEIEALTGATITSRAITEAVKQSLQAFLEQQNKNK